MRINIFKLRKLADVVAAGLEIEIDVEHEAKKATIFVIGYRDGDPARVDVYTGSIREAHAFLEGMALAGNVDIGES